MVGLSLLGEAPYLEKGRREVQPSTAYQPQPQQEPTSRPAAPGHENEKNFARNRKRERALPHPHAPAPDPPKTTTHPPNPY
jgi:hypothetical protein